MVLTSSPAKKREERNLHSECRRRGQKIEFPEQAKEKFANSEFALQAHFVLDEKTLAIFYVQLVLMWSRLFPRISFAVRTYAYLRFLYAASPTPVTQ